MGSSNARLDRRKISKEVEEEYITLDLELEETFEKLKSMDLRKLELDRLKQLRKDVQLIKDAIHRINNDLKTPTVGFIYGSAHFEKHGLEPVLPKRITDKL